MPASHTDRVVIECRPIENWLSRGTRLNQVNGKTCVEVDLYSLPLLIVYSQALSLNKYICFIFNLHIYIYIYICGIAGWRRSWKKTTRTNYASHRVASSEATFESRWLKRLNFATGRSAKFWTLKLATWETFNPRAVALWIRPSDTLVRVPTNV